MTLQASTGLRNALLGSAPLNTAFTSPRLLILSGAAPATADAAQTGTLLCTITGPAAAALAFDAAASGSLPKAAAQVWSGVNAATGTAGYFRLLSSTDTGVLSTTERRLQGTCGTAGADLNMSSVNLTSGATQTIDAATITLPV